MKRIFYLTIIGVLALGIVSCDSHDDTINNQETPSNPTNPSNPTEPTIPSDPSALSGDWATTETVGFDQNGASNAVFSVGENKTVRFSRGNLQYQASTGTWRFAEHQYNYVGDGNDNRSSTYSGWIDLFGWGTSGWNNLQPWCWPNEGDIIYDLTGDHANADWGVYNRISNGGNLPGMWRTLTREEWDYLLFRRDAPLIVSGQYSVRARFGLMILTDESRTVYGIIIFPDNYTGPGMISHEDGCDPADVVQGWTRHAQTWSEIESYGAIFLPYYSKYSYGNSYYWSSSESHGGGTLISIEYPGGLYGRRGAHVEFMGGGLSGFVRLVQDAN